MIADGDKKVGKTEFANSGQQMTAVDNNSHLLWRQHAKANR
jgi:hypothetical protein